MALPPGNYSLNVTLSKKGKSPGVAILQSDDGRTIETPIAFDRWGRGPATVYAYVAGALQSVALKSDFTFTAIALRHKVTRLAASSLAPDAGALITTVDTARTETASLELRGTGLAGAPPEFALLPQGKQIAVLTSWDDGKPEDVRCAEILHKHGYHPSFFLNNNSPALTFLDKLEALGGEVGSHCFNHPSLYTVTPAQAAEECVAMRKVLEQKLGHPVISFGYPNGYSPGYDAEGDYVLRAVRSAGYWSGRTTRSAQETVASSTNLLVMRTDGFFGNAKDLERVWASARTNEGSVFYFWGHSWQDRSGEGPVGMGARVVVP
jgi:peptidoglycan/xylan/chitin deacetylase (PgdA/CDA1 family)